MDFFVKAHASKNKPISKYHRNKEATKKQLKQMLYGYKTSDNAIIKKAEHIKPHFDDSSSVSGFSDLNLSNASYEEDVSSENEESVSDTSFIKDEKKSFVLQPNVGNSNVTNTNSDSEEKSSLYSGNFSFEMDCNDVFSSLNDTELSSDCNILDSLSDDCVSEDFDANGNLAAKIRNKIEENKSKKSKRQDYNLAAKIHNKIEEKESEKAKKQKNKDSFKTKNNSTERKKDISLSENDILYSRQAQSDKTEENHHDFASITSSTSPSSPPFVSITADDMSPQTFDGILGDYKHSTIKIVSSDFHVKVIPDDNDFVAEDSMSVDINTEEEVGSLIPELGEDPLIEDIDDSLIVEPSVQICEDDSIKSSDELLHSDNLLNQDVSTISLRDDMSLNFEFYYSKNSCIVIMKHYAELYIQGKVRLKALGGKVEVFGYNLKNDCHEMYAPYCSFAQCIRTVKNDNVYYGLFNKLTQVGLSVADAENIVTSLGTQDAVIYLERYNSRKIDFIEKNFMLTNLFDSSCKSKDTHFKKASDILGCSLYLHRPQSFFVEHPSWKQATLCARSKQTGVY